MTMESTQKAFQHCNPLPVDCKVIVNNLDTDKNPSTWS